MWIETKKNTRNLYLRDRMEEGLTFNDSGSAQVSEELGSYLIEHFDGIVEKTTEE